MKVFILFLCLSLSLSVQGAGDPYYFVWVEPTQREDGTPLKKEEIDGYIIYGLDGNNKRVYENDIVTPTTATAVDIEDTNGAVRFKILVYDTHGLFSEMVDITAYRELPQPTNVKMR